MNPPVFMLAADHRWQWDEWCDANGVSRDRIGEAKALALDGLLAARARSDAARGAGALLIDQQYGTAALERAAVSGITVGTPVEKPGAFPLEWAADPFWSAIPGDFAKVLIRYRPEWTAEAKAGQLAKLQQLARWCRAHDKPLLLEVLIPRKDEPEERFEAEGRPALLAGVISTCYESGVVPEFWKIEGTPDRDAMRMIDRAISAQPSSRLLILGKGAGFDQIDGWFSAAAVASNAAGFAIGRSVYWQPATDFLAGRMDRNGAVSAIASNYLRVVASWQAHLSGAATQRTSPPR